MTLYEVDYSMLVPEYGVLNIEAVDADDAEMKALKQLTLDAPHADNVEIEAVREIAVKEIINGAN